MASQGRKRWCELTWTGDPNPANWRLISIANNAQSLPVKISKSKSVTNNSDASEHAHRLQQASWPAWTGASPPCQMEEWNVRERKQRKPHLDLREPPSPAGSSLQLPSPSSMPTFQQVNETYRSGPSRVNDALNIHHTNQLQRHWQFEATAAGRHLHLVGPTRQGKWQSHCHWQCANVVTYSLSWSRWSSSCELWLLRHVADPIVSKTRPSPPRQHGTPPARRSRSHGPPAREMANQQDNTRMHPRTTSCLLRSQRSIQHRGHHDEGGFWVFNESMQLQIIFQVITMLATTPETDHLINWWTSLETEAFNDLETSQKIN